MRTVLLAVCGTAMFLGACGQPAKAPEPASVTEAHNDVSAPVLPGKPVVLPPSVVDSRNFRCNDDVIIAVSFLSDGKSALVRVGAAAAVKISADQAAGTMTGGGLSVKGVKGATSISFSSPTHPAFQTCQG